MPRPLHLERLDWPGRTSSPYRGEVLTVVIVALAVLAGGLFALKPKWLHGESKRAAASQEATAKVEQTSAAVDAAQQRKSAEAAASVVMIGRAATTLAPSPEKEFVIREVPVALANLPAPDPQALLEAERRRVAVMEGRIEEVSRLYGDAAKRAEQLSAEVATLRAQRDHALEERRAVDQQLAAAAAVSLASERRQAVLAIVAIVGLGLFAYAKLFGISPATLGRIAAEVRGGANPIAAMDEHLAPWLHARVRKAAALATDLDAQAK